MELDAETEVDTLLAGALSQCSGEEQRLLAALPDGWERSADALVDAIAQRLQAPTSGSFRDEESGRLTAHVREQLATLEALPISAQDLRLRGAVQ